MEDELSEPWQLDRTRILAVRPTVQGDPDIVLGTRAEGRPGETLSFEALTYTPDDEPIGGVMWIACLDEENPNDGCNLDDSDGKDKDDVDLDAESGFIGFEPFLSPVLPIPEGVLDSIPEEEREEGISALVNVIAIPESEMEKFEDEDEDEEDLKLDVDDYEIAFKRVPVSESPTPNHNPDIVDFVVAGERLDGAAGFTARTEKTYVIEPRTRGGAHRDLPVSGLVRRGRVPNRGALLQLVHRARLSQYQKRRPLRSALFAHPLHLRRVDGSQGPRRDHHPRGRAGSPRRDGLALTDGQRFVRTDLLRTFIRDGHGRTPVPHHHLRAFNRSYRDATRYRKWCFILAFLPNRNRRLEHVEADIGNRGKHGTSTVNT